MNRLLVSAALLGCVLGCPNNVAGPTGEFCEPAWGIGPMFTESGSCGGYELCVPAAYATCTGNNCCHYFCEAPGGCGPNVACISILPDVIPDGGLDGLCPCTDAGPCVCADAGAPCFAASCLGVCGE